MRKRSVQVMKAEDAIVRYLANRQEGASSVSIATDLGAPARGTAKRLQQLKADGRVIFAGIPAHGVWTLTENAELTTEILARRMDARKLASREKENARKRYLWSTRAQRAQIKPQQPGRPAWEDTMPEHRRVSAASAAPLPKRGPSSVWELAA